MTDANDSALNPYASPALLESAPRKRSILPQPILAAGTIGLAERRDGLLLAWWVTRKDWIGYLVMSGMAGAVAVVVVGPGSGGLMWGEIDFVPFAIAALVVGVSIAIKLARWRWAKRAAERLQRENGDLRVERRIDDDGIAARIGEHWELTPWREYTQGRASDDLIVLTRGTFEQYQIFPRSHFATAWDWQLFGKAAAAFVRKMH
jgi:hypothetical protein